MVRVRIDYHYTIPGSWGGRTAVTPSSKGDIFEIAQWFPRMAVYDVMKKAATLYLRPFIEDLKPALIVAFGQVDVPMFLDRTGLRLPIPWNRSQAETPAVIREREAAATKILRCANS
jgi:hypothetical protein